MWLTVNIAGFASVPTLVAVMRSSLYETHHRE
jgi:hypothetical protein